MIVGYNNTAYYPSTADLASSLTLANSSSSEFTLRAMAIVSLIIPFIVAYIAYFWRQMDKKSLTTEELDHSENTKSIFDRHKGVQIALLYCLALDSFFDE